GLQRGVCPARGSALRPWRAEMPSVCRPRGMPARREGQHAYGGPEREIEKVTLFPMDVPREVHEGHAAREPPSDELHPFRSADLAPGLPARLEGVRKVLEAARGGGAIQL